MIFRDSLLCWNPKLNNVLKFNGNVNALKDQRWIAVSFLVQAQNVVFYKHTLHLQWWPANFSSLGSVFQDIIMWFSKAKSNILTEWYIMKCHLLPSHRRKIISAGNTEFTEVSCEVKHFWLWALTKNLRFSS